MVKNYCIIALGDINGIIDVISKISKTNPRKMEQTGLLVATFVTDVALSEIKKLINNTKKTFFIFEVNENSLYQVGRKDIEDSLFSYMLENGLDDGGEIIQNDKPPIDNDFSYLTKSEINDKINFYLDKGFDNLTLDEKNMLTLLGKYL